MKHARALRITRIKRRRSVRAKLFGTAKRPRLTVSRSNRSLSVQLIDDERRTTLAHASTRELSKEERTKPKKDQARFVGVRLAEKAAKLGITQVVFDRGSYRYHGRVAALAEGAREKGLHI